MKYYKSQDEDNFYHQVCGTGFTIKITENDDWYKIEQTQENSDDVSQYSEEIDEEEYKNYADNVSAFSRSGSHPPSSPH